MILSPGQSSRIVFLPGRKYSRDCAVAAMTMTMRKNLEHHMERMSVLL